MSSFHVIAGAGDTIAHPVIRTITIADVFDALREGAADFWARPSHYVMAALIFPVIGIALMLWVDGFSAWPLLFPLVGGFALIGPFAAIGLYEISHRREQGLDTAWHHAFEVWRSPAIGSIIAVGIMLFVLFALWLTVAESLYQSIFGASTPPDSLAGLWTQVFTQPGGMTLLIVGTLLGALFALVVLCTSVITFPLLLDQDVGAYVAVETSLRAARQNPLPLLVWGVIVGAGLFIGAISFFVGLALVIPVFGHATWHLYRKLVEPASMPR